MEKKSLCMTILVLLLSTTHQATAQNDHHYDTEACASRYTATCARHEVQRGGVQNLPRIDGEHHQQMSPEVGCVSPRILYDQDIHIPEDTTILKLDMIPTLDVSTIF